MSYLIWSHQHNAWWRPDARGYTGRISEAGRYTRAQADQALRWDSPREWLHNGTPHEVLVEAPDPRKQHQLDEILALDNRIQQATYEAITERAGREVSPDAPTKTIRVSELTVGDHVIVPMTGEIEMVLAPPKNGLVSTDGTGPDSAYMWGADDPIDVVSRTTASNPSAGAA